MDYAAANAATRRFKAALTRAKNQKNHDAVIKVADDMEAVFRAKGWPLPDAWARWDVAREDARFAKERAAALAPTASW
jgi:hypothetical protein